MTADERSMSWNDTASTVVELQSVHYILLKLIQACRALCTASHPLPCFFAVLLIFCPTVPRLGHNINDMSQYKSVFIVLGHIIVMSQSGFS